MKTQTFRQGDVLLIPVKKIPTGLHKTKVVTLALGEVTGHHHTIYSGAVGFADSENDTALAEFIEIGGEDAVLTHQEHSPITIPAGKYRSVIQSEYTPERLVNVAD